ncbi:MAG: hypothetical protein DRO00_09195 [Thermoproteota archaeon]|nr:MAG: hypothetical protein DRO00_09195 [Candidatus Korarchaeota archaeon]
MYMVDDPVGVIVAGLKLYMASVGKPVAERDTSCAVPEISVSCTTTDPEPDAGKVRLLGVTEISKSNSRAGGVGDGVGDGVGEGVAPTGVTVSKKGFDLTERPPPVATMYIVYVFMGVSLAS